MRQEYPGSAYTIIKTGVGGGWEFHEPVTGLRSSAYRFDDAMAGMHRRIIARRDELAARDPASLDAAERRDLAHLRGYGEFFLREGIRVASRAA